MTCFMVDSESLFASYWNKRNDELFDGSTSWNGQNNLSQSKDVVNVVPKSVITSNVLTFMVLAV